MTWRGQVWDDVGDTDWGKVQVQERHVRETTITLANGVRLPILGQGGWGIGDDPRKAEEEARAMLLGIDLGLTTIDTAEMYGDGASERFIGKTLSGRRRETYQLVSKVYPHNAGAPQIFRSCEGSLRRLGTDYLDLYLLHWRGNVPLSETVDCMERLVRDGKIRGWGVSNFDVKDMEELWAVEGGQNCVADQVLYNLGSRGIEFDLLPWLRPRSVLAIAYCPLAQAGTLRRMHRDFETDPALRAVSEKYGITVMQLLLAFVLRQPGLVAIPKASTPSHVEQNARVLDISIHEDDWMEVDKTFWPPTTKMHLDME